MDLQTLLVPAACVLIGFVVGYLLGSRRSEVDTLVRPAPQPPAGSAVASSSVMPTQIYDVDALPPEIMAPIRAEMERGHKISAIKLLREATGLGLKESKELVESWMR